MIKIIKETFLTLFLLITATNGYAGEIRGKVIDKSNGEPLIGVTIMLSGTNSGASTDGEGHYELKIPKAGSYIIEVRYIFYKNIVTEAIKISDKSQIVLDFAMEPENLELETVTVTGKANKENESALLSQRKISAAQIENLGAKEMSVKGLSNVQEGMKKVTGVSFAETGQLFVRGLGDRYSITTLNGLPIASPNPDNKLIPLDLFPASTVQNITVSKVYQPEAYADYSGAHIDIKTKEIHGKSLFVVSFDLSGKAKTLFQPFYQSDKRWGLWNSNNISKNIVEMSPRSFSDYVKQSDPFKTSFSISKSSALPGFSGLVAFGKEWERKNGDSWNLLASLSLGNTFETMRASYVTNLTAQGEKLNEFYYDSFTGELRVAGLANLSYNFKKGDNLTFTTFFSRNASDNFKLRKGYDSEGIHLTGNNSVFHEYSLFINQLKGIHKIGKKWNLNWGSSFGITESNEPDRRQVMYRTDEGNITLFKLNQQETMRYFGDLKEKEGVANIGTEYRFGENNIKSGISFKYKKRDFNSVRFYYNISKINPTITDVLNTEDFLNRGEIESGKITVNKDAQPKSNYYAESMIAAGYASTDLFPIEKLLVNIGLRYEYAYQSVDYWTDASIGKQSLLKRGDLFPALNLRYLLNQKNTFRFALSRTITRPSFIEMAPFLYKESYGSAEIRGNENITNGYNYNFDLRYELSFPNTNNFISMTAYYKILQTPIEQVQESSGGSAVYTFRNAETGSAAGMEVEVKQTIFPFLRASFNASLMLTNVILPEDGGIYTDTRRPLQGASPYLINADLVYVQPLKNQSELSISALYNLQGPRIHAVGIYGMGNVIQKPLSTIDLVCAYRFNSHWSLSLQVRDLLNSVTRFEQEIKNTGKVIEVQRYSSGIGVKLGISYDF